MTFLNFTFSLFVLTCCAFVSPLTPLLYAADIDISASVDKNTVSINDQLVLEVTVSGAASNLPNPEIPALPDFTVYSSGRSQNVSIINGQVSSSINFKYVLVPKNILKTSIPPITMTYNGQIYQTQRIPIEVVAASTPPTQNTSPQQSASGKPEPQLQQSSADLFVIAEVDKPVAYVNEQITYTFRFYTRTQLLSNPQYSPSDFSGFWAEEMPPKNYNTLQNGKRYVVTEVKTLLFPTKSGTFLLKEASLTCQIPDFNPNDFFSNFFSQGKTRILQSKPMTITIKPLPAENKLRTFTGAVGQFILDGDLDKKTAKVNEAVTLTITIAGTGNIKTITEPPLPDWPDFRKYETVSSLNTNKETGILKGSKVFKTVIVPQTPGHKKVGPIQFSYFDIAAKRYKTLQTPVFNLEVKPGEQGDAFALTETKSDITIMSRDIRFLKTPESISFYSGHLYTHKWFITLIILPLLFLGAVFIYMSWQERLTKDVAYARRIRASGTAKKYLKKARRLLTVEHKLDFYNAVSRAILEYIANKTNVSAEGLTSLMICDTLTKAKIKPETIGQITRILEECDLVRFAPAQVNKEMMQALYTEAAETITILEKEF